MTPIDQIKAFVAANPAARVWVEEALFRGAPGEPGTFGTIAGAHFVVGVETPNPLGQPTRQLLGPFPAALVPEGDTSGMAELIGLVTIKQQQTLDAQAQSIESLTATVATRDATIERLLADAQDAATSAATAVEERDATIGQLRAQVAELEAAAAAGEANPQP
jgi:hypothetical protein